MLSIIATVPMRAEGWDCYCLRSNPKNRECGQVSVLDSEDKPGASAWLKLDRNIDNPAIEAVQFPFLKWYSCSKQGSDPARPGSPPPARPGSPPPARPGSPPPERPGSPPPERPGSPPPERPGSSPIPAPAGASFGVYGSNTIGEKLMPRLIEAFAGREELELEGRGCNSRLILRAARSSARTPPETTVECSAAGTHTGIPALKAGKADIAMLSRPITAEEQRTMQAANEGDMTSPEHEHVLALDGVLVIVSPDNPATALTLDQIAGIFAGDITNWSELGLPPGPIRLYVRDENSGTRDTLHRLVMEPRGLAFSKHSVTEFSSSSELSDRVAADRLGIGFVGYGYRHAAKALNIQQSCGIVHQPTIAAIKSEDYPLVRRLFLYTGKPHLVLSADLVNYALSADAQQVIENADFINLSIAAEGVEEARARIRRYEESPPVEPELEFNQTTFRQLRRSIDGAERLSISFRFRSGSATLDSRAHEDLKRLAEYLHADGRGRRVLLAGFTDAKGPFAYNLKLSRRRASEVRSALAAIGLAPNRLTSDGFGELLPVSCNGDDEGRRKDRRVEVWLLPGSWR
jgi:phosphate transport system substrate-binding protein